MIFDDKSREEWLQRRRQFVSATDVARLARGGQATWATIRNEKLTGESSFRGNRYTEWGNEREPHIVSLLTFLHGLEPNRKFMVLDGTVWGATPDAISETMTGEVKTSVKPLGETAEELRKINPGYYDQVQWAMLAADRAVCAFAWELNDNFAPAPGASFLVERDEERIAALITVAEEFLEYLENGDEPGEYDDLLAAYVDAKAAEDEAKARVSEVLERIRERAGDADLAVKSPFGSISLTFPKPRETFDSAAFKKAHPDTYAEYVKTATPSQRTLRVTPKKGS